MSMILSVYVSMILPAEFVCMGVREFVSLRVCACLRACVCVCARQSEFV